MNTEELSNRLTQILTGITTGEPNPNIIQGFVQNFIEDFKPDYYYEISVTDVEGYAPTFIEYYAWDEDEDGPIPGIICHCQTNKPTNQEPIYESEHIIILDSDSTIGCQE